MIRLASALQNSKAHLVLHCTECGRKTHSLDVMNLYVSRVNNILPFLNRKNVCIVISLCIVELIATDMIHYQCKSNCQNWKLGENYAVCEPTRTESERKKNRKNAINQMTAKYNALVLSNRITFHRPYINTHIYECYSFLRHLSFLSNEL